MGLGDFFFKKEAPIEAPKQAPKAQVAIMNFGGDDVRLPPVSVGNVDYGRVIDDAIANTKVAGKPGYISFMSSIEKMAKISLPEKGKYETVFITFDGMGVTSNQLVKDAEDILTNLQGPFTASVTKEFEDTRAAEVHAKEKEAEKLQAEIVELNRQAEEKSIRVNQLLAEKEEAAQQLFVEENNFNNTLTAKINQINSNMGKIKTYLNAAVTEQ